MTSIRQKADRAAGAGIAVLAGAFAVFFLLPFAGLVVRGVREDRTWDLMTSATAVDALRLSIATSTATVAIALVFGTPVAYLLARSRFAGRAVIDAMVDLPIVLPPTVAGVALLTAFGRRGIIGRPIEEWTGLTFGFSTTAVVMAQVLVAAPFFVRAAKAGFEAVDPQFERVAHTLGASRTRAFFQVVVPQAWPALLAGTVLCWARAMGELGATLIFAGSMQGKTQTMPLAIVGAFESSSLGLAGAIALSLVLLTVALGFLVAFRAVASRAPGAS